MESLLSKRLKSYYFKTWETNNNKKFQVFKCFGSFMIQCQKLILNCVAHRKKTWIPKITRNEFYLENSLFQILNKICSLQEILCTTISKIPTENCDLILGVFSKFKNSFINIFR